MALGTIPPQAYTKETLAQAYNWLKDQPEEVARYATNPDRLVAIFLRSKKGFKVGDLSGELGAQELQRFTDSRSRENFDTQAHLRELLRDPQAAAPQMPPQGALQSTPMASPVASPQTPPLQTHSHEGAPHREPPPPSRENQLARVLGPSCYELIQHVKSSLNMESDIEVLRLLTTLGYEKAKTILPSRS